MTNMTFSSHLFVQIHTAHITPPIPATNASEATIMYTIIQSAEKEDKNIYKGREALYSESDCHQCYKVLDSSDIGERYDLTTLNNQLTTQRSCHPNLTLTFSLLSRCSPVHISQLDVCPWRCRFCAGLAQDPIKALNRETFVIQ